MCSESSAADNRVLQHASWLVFMLALLVRLASLPFTTLDSADSTARVQVGWLWSEHPFYIVAGGWGPLHYYMIGAAMRLWPDPIWAPALLHVVLGALAALFIYKLSLELFHNRRAALLAGVAFAAYPLAIVTSLEAHPEVPCVMLLAISMTYLVRAWRAEGGLLDAVVAGLALTLASMLRYEIWMIMPLLTVPLLWQWKKIAAFLVPALMHPVAWMIGSTLKFGNPLYSFAWSDSYEREIMKHAQVADLTLATQKAWQLLMVTERGLSLPIAILVALGVLWCLRTRRAESIWLLPGAGLFLLVVIAAARGSLWFKPSYTLTYGALTIPFIAAFFAGLHVERWTWRWFSLTPVLLLAAVWVTTIEPLWSAVPHGGVVLTHTFGHFTEERETAALVSMLNDGRSLADDTLIADFIGWQPTAYLTARSKVHPANTCVPSGTPVPVDLPAIQLFLLDHREGTLVTYDKGRLTAQIKQETPDTVKLAGVTLQLNARREFPWPGAADAGDVGPGTLVVSRYRVIRQPETRTRVGPGCTTACPVSLCSI
jgi:Dolichyl-phosphate-mannose-protein mannosyltransferase